MRTKFGAVSLIALALLAGAPVVAYAEKANVVPEAQGLPPAVLAMLDDPRKPPELSVPELQDRIRLAKRGLSVRGLPDKTVALLEKKLKFASGELERRQGGGVVAEGDDEPVAPPARPPKRVAAENPPPAAAPPPNGAAALLNDGRTRESIPTPELSARAKQAFSMARDGNVPEDVRNQLVAMSRADRAELIRRQQGADDAMDGDAPPPPPRKRSDVVVNAPEDQPQATAPPPPPQPAQVNPTEQEARTFLANARPVKELSDDKLRKRVNRMRGFLQSGQLQPATVEALRQRLDLERNALRRRSGDGGGAPEPQQVERTKSKTNVEISIVLGDRRQSDQLTEAELQRRIQVYRDIERADDYASYDAEQRDYWRQTMSRDRDLLRRRLLEERRQREKQIAEEEDNGTLQKDVIIEARPRVSEVPADDIYVAEADERQIEDVLIAPPRQRIDRRYTIDEVSNDPRIRRSIPRLEIDTIRFGFGEAIVREEEVGKLDQVGAAMERIVARYPNEVFLIEGHTDAVGSDVANLSLSRARADAVKRALVTYYDIPPENLRTVGLGERFLRIPTPYAEAENRRVSISRVTNFLSQAD